MGDSCFAVHSRLVIGPVLEQDRGNAGAPSRMMPEPGNCFISDDGGVVPHKGHLAGQQARRQMEAETGT